MDARQVPPKFLEYRHFGEEHYLTSLGREVRGQKDIAGARRVETLGFLPLYMWKLVAGLALNPKEGSLRTLYRLVMLVLLPGDSTSVQWTSVQETSQEVMPGLQGPTHFVREL